MEVDLNEEIESKGGMWALEQNIDQPMDEEAGRLKNMYREKVAFCHFLFSHCLYLYFPYGLVLFLFLSLFLAG